LTNLTRGSVAGERFFVDLHLSGIHLV